MLGAYLGLGMRLVRPAVEEFLTELAQFLDHALLGGVGIGAVDDGFSGRVVDVMEAGAQLGPLRQALFERAVGLENAGGSCRFIVRQPLHLQTPEICTIGKCRIPQILLPAATSDRTTAGMGRWRGYFGRQAFVSAWRLSSSGLSACLALVGIRSMNRMPLR